MAYDLTWRTPNLPRTAEDIEVPVGQVNTETDLVLTGKGFSNYGMYQQTNLLRLLENFAGPVAPDRPTIGETWYDTDSKVLKVCTGVVNRVASWKSLGGIQVAQAAPGSPNLGDLWFQATGPWTGFLFIYTGLGRYPSTATEIGGWEQVWPTPNLIAGREEYEEALEFLTRVLGPTTGGGSNALGKIVSVTDLNALDEDLRAKYRQNPDENVIALAGTETLTSVEEHLRIDPNSQDWDSLLAATKWAVDRLELPAGMVEDVSPVPFVIDGRPASQELLSLPEDDPRFPTIDRRINKRYSTLTLSRLYSETMNVLANAAANRYALKGINDLVFDSSVQVYDHAAFSGVTNRNTANITLSFKFNSEAERDAFIYSGGALQLDVKLENGTGAGDADAAALLDQLGKLVLTADRLRIFNKQAPAQLTRQLPFGLAAATAGGVSTGNQTNQNTAANFNLTVSKTGAPTPGFTVNFLLTAPGVMNGTFTAEYSVIHDSTEFGSPPQPLFPTPLDFSAADKAGDVELIPI